MKDVSLNFVIPKGTVWNDSKTFGANGRKPVCFFDNVFRDPEDNILSEVSIKGGENSNPYPYKNITQEIKDIGDVSVKTTTISPYSIAENFPVHKTTQRLTKDGHYSVVRQVGDKIVGGYEIHPKVRKFMTGFKGKVEALAMKIGTNSEGFERPVLRRVAGLMLYPLRKIK